MTATRGVRSSVRAIRWVWQLVKNIVNNDLHNHAAEMAYFAMMSVFPFFLLLTAAVAYLPIPGLVGEVMSLLRTFAPADVVRLLERTVTNTASKTDMISVTAFVAIWMSIGAMSSTTRGLNKCFGMSDPRHYLRFFGLVLLLTILLGTLTILAILLILLGPKIHSEILSRVDLGWFGDLLLNVFRYGIAGFFLLVVHAGIYWVCPAVERRFRLFTPGALLAVAAWVVVSYFLQVYLRHFNNYDKIYGSLGVVILTLFWFYLMSFVLLIGGQVDAMLHPEYRAQIGPDGNPIATRFPTKLVLSSIVFLIIVVCGIKLLMTQGTFLPRPHRIRGPLGESIERSISSGITTFSHEDYDSLLRGYVDDEGNVDYTGLKAEQPRLDAYLERIASIEIADCERSELHALMLNLYNASVLKLVLQQLGQIESIGDIPNRYDRRFIRLGGQIISLNDIEHDILRFYFKDVRDHFAICRGDKSSPRLQRFAFNGRDLDAQLERVTRDAFRPGAIVVEDKKVRVNQVVALFAKDIQAQGNGSLTPFLLRYIEDEAARAILEASGDNAIEFMRYVGSLNGK